MGLYEPCLTCSEILSYVPPVSIISTKAVPTWNKIIHIRIRQVIGLYWLNLKKIFRPLWFDLIFGLYSIPVYLELGLHTFYYKQNFEITVIFSTIWKYIWCVMLSIPSLDWFTYFYFSALLLNNINIIMRFHNCLFDNMDTGRHAFPKTVIFKAIEKETTTGNWKGVSFHIHWNYINYIDFIPCFNRVRVAKSVMLCVVLFRLLFHCFPFCLWAIILSVLVRFTVPS